MLKITVGASLDRSTLAVFSQMADAAKRAAAQMATAEKKAADDGDKAYRAAAKAVEGYEREKTREVQRAAKARAAAEKAAIKEIELDARRAAREREKAEKEASHRVVQALREEAREAKRLNEERIRDSKRREREEARQAGEHRRGVVGGLRTGFGLAARGMRFAAGVGRDVLGGMGVDTSFQSLVSRNVALEDAATSLANAAYMPGKAGAAGIRQDPRLLMQESFGIGTRTGFRAGEVMGGMEQFVRLTGDLETARSVMERLAMLSKATGSNLDDMAAAAGNVSNALGDVPNKAMMVDEVMRQIAGQGKLGAVEIKDLAVQMAKVAAYAPMMEGGTARNIQTFGIIAQEARAHGGASSATQAAQSVMALMAQLTKGARIKGFKDMGVSTQDETTGKFRDIAKILPEAFAAAARRTGGVGSNFQQAMNTMIADQQAQRASRGFQTAFQSAYAATSGTKEEKIAAGIAAVNQEFENLRKAAIREAELRESFSRAMETSKSKSEQWNNALQEATLELQDKLIPLMPALVDAFTGLLGGVKAVVDFLQEAGIIKKENRAAGSAAQGSKAVALTLSQFDEGIQKGELSQAQIDQAKALAAKQGQDLASAEEAAKGAGQHGTISRFVRGELSVMREALPTALGGSEERAGLQAFPLFAAFSAYQQGEKLDKLEQGQVLPGEAAHERLNKLNQTLESIKNGTLKVHITNPTPGSGGPQADPGESNMPTE